MCGGVGPLCLGQGLFEVSQQHGRHHALLRVEGEQGGGQLPQLQRHQDQRAAAHRLPGKPAG